MVLLGSFNPAIFTPAWFAWHEILPRSTAEAAQVEVVHRQLTVFSFDWLRLEVSGDRFSVETSLAPHIRVRDLVVRVFKEHLHHTPLKAFGINRSVHFRLQSTGQRDRMGKKLAPAQPWGDCGHALSLGDEGNGLRSLTMTQICPDGRGDGDQINIGNDWTPDQLEDAVRHARIDRSSISTHLAEQAMDQMTIIPNEQGILAPIVDLRPSVRLQPTATLHALQEWEGYVIEIGPQEFRAHLIDLTAGSPHEQEEAAILLAEVSDRDAKRMVVGSIFRWVIGYERSPAGTKRRVSQIVFRDLPAITEKDLQEGRSWAQDLMQAFAP